MKANCIRPRGSGRLFAAADRAGSLRDHLATYQEATGDILRACIRAGMIPSINSLMTVGLVSLPGMMAGQILAGADPMTSIKYQIIVMLMIVASVAIGCVIVVYIIRRLCFNTAHQLQI